MRILATRDVKPGERLLADYGEHYWAAWRLLFGDAMRAFFDDVGALFMDRNDGGGCGVAALLRYARERRVFAAPSRPNDFPAARPFWRESARSGARPVFLNFATAWLQETNAVVKNADPITLAFFQVMFSQ